MIKLSKELWEISTPLKERKNLR